MGDLTSVRRRLTKLLNVDSKLDDQVQALQQVFVYTKGAHLTHEDEVIYEVIQYSQSHDVRIKKLVYLYLSMVGHINQDVILHATNSMQSDLSHPNPLVRGSTLRLLSDITLTTDTVKDFVTSSTAEGLKDDNSYVRSVAVDAVIKKKLDLMKEINVVLQTDSDPGVVVRCLDCKSFHGGNVQDLLLSLLDRITLVDNFLKLPIITRAIQCLQVKNEDVVFRVLNAIEPVRKQTSDLSLSMEASALMLKVSSTNVEVARDVMNQTITALLNMFSCVGDNWQYVILSSLHFFVTRQPEAAKDLLTPSTKMFLVQFGDSESIKIKKIEILTAIATEDCANIILTNLLRYINRNSLVAAKTFALLTSLHKFLPNKCETILRNCLESHNEQIVAEAVEASSRIVIKQSKDERTIFLKSIFKLIMNSYKHCHTVSSKSALLWLLSQNTDIDNCAQLHGIIISEVKNFISEFASPVVQQAVLASCMRLFLQWPHVFEKQLKELFGKIAGCQNCLEIQEQAKMYYLILKNDIDLAHQLLEPFSNAMPHDKTNKRLSAVEFGCISSTT